MSWVTSGKACMGLGFCYSVYFLKGVLKEMQGQYRAGRKSLGYLSKEKPSMQNVRQTQYNLKIQATQLKSTNGLNRLLSNQRGSENGKSAQKEMLQLLRN